MGVFQGILSIVCDLLILTLVFGVGVCFRSQLPHEEQEAKRDQGLGIPFKGAPLMTASSSQFSPPQAFS